MEKKAPKLVPELVKGRITVLKTVLYRGSMVYIRMIDTDVFEYLLVFKNEIYSDYLIMKPREGETVLSDVEIKQCSDLIFAGASATLDTLGGVKMSKEQVETVKAFEKGRKK